MKWNIKYNFTCIFVFCKRTYRLTTFENRVLKKEIWQQRKEVTEDRTQFEASKCALFARY